MNLIHIHKNRPTHTLPQASLNLNSLYSFYVLLEKSLRALAVIFSLHAIFFYTYSLAFEKELPRANKLTGTLTANCVDHSTTYYNWILSKTFSPQQTPFVIKTGKTVPATFSISIRKITSFTGEGIGPITGQVCLTNSDTQSTRNLKISTTVQVQNIGGFEDIATQEIPISSEIAPQETRCYFYIYNNLITQTQKLYRVNAFISTEATSLVRKPSTFVLSTLLHTQNITNSMDDTSILKDVFQCPTGFNCTPLSFTETYSGPKALSYQVLLSNVSAPCGKILFGKNTATLTGTTSQYSQSASAQIKIYTGKCNYNPSEWEEIPHLAVSPTEDTLEQNEN